MSVSRTRRWRGVIAVTLVAGAVGLATRRPNLLVVAGVGVVFAVYPLVTRPPVPDVTLSRELSDANPAPGDDVTVTVTVENAGEHTLPDLRVVDGVPPALEVVDGSPRRALALAPGGRASFAYDVEARPGTHHFEAATVLARDLAGSVEVEGRAEDRCVVSCPAATDVPVSAGTRWTAGTAPGTRSGGGVEFAGTREYRPGDPTSRIDWKAYAKTGTLSTVAFRAERSATVVVAADLREPSYRGPPGEPHAAVEAVGVAEEIARSLLDQRNRVGVATLGGEGRWVRPGTGREHETRLERAFEGLPPRDPPAPTPPGADLERLRVRLPAGAQVVVVSPLHDDAAARAIRTLDADGHQVVVVAPDVTVHDGPGHRIAAVERADRLGRLRNAGVTVLNYSATGHLAHPVPVEVGWSAP